MNSTDDFEEIDLVDPNAPARPSAPIAPTEPPSEREAARLALRDLIRHSTECADLEQQIEQHHATQVEAEEKKLDKQVFEVNERVKKQKEQIAQKYADHVGQLRVKHETELRALKNSDQSVRRKLQEERESVDRNVKKEFDNAAWLAESVFDGENAALQKQAKEFREKLEGENTEIDLLEARSQQLMRTYGQPPVVVEASEQAKSAVAADAEAAFTSLRAETEKHLGKLGFQPVARLFVGLWPVVLIVLICGGAAIGAWYSGNHETPDFKRIGIFAGAGFAVAIALGIALKLLANRQVRAAYHPFRESLDGLHRASQRRLENFTRQQDLEKAAAAEKRQSEVRIAREKFQPHLVRAKERYDSAMATHKAEIAAKHEAVESAYHHAHAEADAWQKRNLDELTRKHQADLSAVQSGSTKSAADEKKRHGDERAALLDRWQTGLVELSNPIHSDSAGSTAPLSWDDPAWANWKPPTRFATRVRFGELKVDVKQVLGALPQDKPFGLPVPDAFALPAMLSFPAHGSLMIHSDRTGRPAALAALQMVMARILTSMPAGRAKFTIIDPVGLGQNFAGFMHLADYDDSLVGSRIWTDAEQIEQRLIDLTEHMETVIQKYLRNEFATIDDYNVQAGELAEPYRFLVIADLPVGFQGDSFRRLASIATSGPKCGVYLLIARDSRQAIPSGSHIDEVEAHCVNLVHAGQGFIWRDEVFRQFPLKVDPPPAEAELTKLMHVVGVQAKRANRVEVPFETIAPANGEFWSMSSREELRVPIGRMGATRLQQLKLGKGVAQHSLIAGKTGSGKSTLLHAMITNLALWYPPEEVEFYLIDFKKGVEFKTYGVHALPHARAIAVESDREFGLSVLQRLDTELGRRGELFRKASVQDLPSYRQVPGAEICPRTLLMIDEFQEYFSEDDKLAQEAGLLLDRLVRQGRAFGIHVLLGSQTIAGSGGLARSTISQMAVRIALQCSEADSQLILGDNNSAARLLSRPGEAIYNDVGGLVEGNSPFQIAWLSDEQREQYLIKIRAAADAKNVSLPAPIVFEGNAPANVATNRPLEELIFAPKVAPTLSPLAYLGDPVAIKAPTAIPVRRQAGSNVLIIGQQDELAVALLSMSIISLAAQATPKAAQFYVFDGTPADSALAGSFVRVKDALPHEIKIVEWRATAEVIDQLSKEVQSRIDDGDAGKPSIYLMICGLQRFRTLRKADDDFSFSLSSDDGPKPPNTGKQFAEIMKDGPAVGIHIFAWADTPVSVERTLDRTAMREFDNRILFQMSANDSSNLIDSPAANKLGFYRALAYSEEQGVLEKFRPYAVPTAAWLQTIHDKLAHRKP